jgi:hypothetical protein
MASENIKQLPYGLADFWKIQRSNMYYVDKTRFIPLLEAGSRFVFFIRPRRFGKTLWLSVLENYYDIGFKERFKETFKGTFIGEHPTEERNSYLVLMFNFAMVNPEPQSVRESFEANGQTIIRDFLRRYAQFFDEHERSAILSFAKTEDQLRELFVRAADKNLKIYVLIDEYDNFANTILTAAGEHAYRELTHGAGFFRYFFNLLKGATSGRTSGLTRLFITGVSPITMDDVTSGFNIGENITLDRQIHDLLGFREEEVLNILEYYKDTGKLHLDVSLCLDVMSTWYDHYRFSTRATDQVFNPDMVLYFLKQVMKDDLLPETMIDQNIRIDYGKLRHLVLVDRKFNGNFSILKEIIETGETISALNVSFPLERLLDRANFVSLLFYLGLVSIADTMKGSPLLRIPNRTVEKLMYGYLRDAFYDVDVFRLEVWSFANLIRNMAYDGEWQPVFDFLAEEVKKQTSVRDYLAGEKVIQEFLLAYLNVTDYFLTWSEREMKKGFADLYLEPFLARFPDMRYGYVIELKYIPRQEFSDTKLQENIKEAKQQAKQYAEDERIQKTSQNVTLKKLVLIYNGWELVHREEMETCHKNTRIEH